MTDAMTTRPTPPATLDNLARDDEGFPHKLMLDV